MCIFLAEDKSCFSALFAFLFDWFFLTLANNDLFKAEHDLQLFQVNKITCLYIK